MCHDVCMLEPHVCPHISRLSDRQLLDSLAAALRRQRTALAEIIVHLSEVEERRLHLKAAQSSMFNYCVQRLDMSEDEACRRIDLARLTKRFPALLTEVANGQISLSVALLLKPVLSVVNCTELLAAVRGLSIRQVREHLAARFPQPDVASNIRKLPERLPERAEPEHPPVRALPDFAAVVTSTISAGMFFAAHLDRTDGFSLLATSPCAGGTEFGRGARCQRPRSNAIRRSGQIYAPNQRCTALRGARPAREHRPALGRALPRPVHCRCGAQTATRARSRSVASCESERRLRCHHFARARVAARRSLAQPLRCPRSTQGSSAAEAGERRATIGRESPECGRTQHDWLRPVRFYSDQSRASVAAINCS
jgi:hypothetical protein